MLNEIDLARVDLNLLVVFDVVFHTHHVGRAAAKLHVSPSAVSHGLGRLRQLLDDPLFHKTPRGVVPTARAQTLAPAIADVLGRVRGVLGAVETFDPKRSRRRFTLGTADATAAVMIPNLLARFRRQAPGIDLGVVQLLPRSGFDALESRKVDLLVLDEVDVPPRFFSQALCEDEFVVAARRGHPYLQKPSLRRFCALQHMLVSSSGQAHGYLDAELAKRGLTRRVAVTVPSFMLALAALKEGDLLAAIPKSLVQAEAARFGLASVKAPIPLRHIQLVAITLKTAVQDAGVAWLLKEVSAVLS
jgi:DNA-binding transcriptional LysR family regulator